MLLFGKTFRTAPRPVLKSLLILVGLFGLAACAPSNYYVLSTASQPSVSYVSKRRVIGVEKVTLPKYLFKREIAVAKSPSQVTFLNDAVWAEDLDSGLTRRLIGFLQKKFNQPEIYLYPWGLDTQPSLKVKVQITRFIAYHDKVYLDASWEVEDMQSHKRFARLFTTTVPTGKDAPSIVAAMDRAFGMLEEDVSRGIKGF
jgi:cholesterol transport system auxiliary component